MMKTSRIVYAACTAALMLLTMSLFTTCDLDSSFTKLIQEKVNEDLGTGDSGTTDDGDEDAVDVLFQSADQTGGTSGTADSTGLTLTFDVDPTTLAAGDITVSGATRTLGISAITVADGEAVSVAITSPSGFTLTGSPQTAVVYRAPYIGMPYQGGIIAYIYQSVDPGYVSGEIHGLIAATEDQSTGIVWISGGSTQTTSVPSGTGTALGTGSSNTDNIIAQAEAAGNNTPTSYAAGLARAHDGGGYNDWYLPSKDELDKLYPNRAAIGGFASGVYWSSSEDGSSDAWVQYFGNGALGSSSKGGYKRVRAVRGF